MITKKHPPRKSAHLSQHIPSHDIGAISWFFYPHIIWVPGSKPWYYFCGSWSSHNGKKGDWCQAGWSPCRMVVVGHECASRVDVDLMLRREVTGSWNGWNEMTHDFHHLMCCLYKCRFCDVQGFDMMYMFSIWRPFLLHAGSWGSVNAESLVHRNFPGRQYPTTW